MARLSLVALMAGWITVSTASADSGSREYWCEPAIPVFCRNIHLGCAGRTGIPTVSFHIRVSGGHAWIAFANAASEIPGSVASGQDLVVRPAGSADWIRIEPDGDYSHRTYRDPDGAMSKGYCAASHPLETGS